MGGVLFGSGLTPSGGRRPATSCAGCATERGCSPQAWPGSGSSSICEVEVHSGLRSGLQSELRYFTVIELTKSSRSAELSAPFSALMRIAKGTSSESTPATTTPVIRVPFAGVESSPVEVNS